MFYYSCPTFSGFLIVPFSEVDLMNSASHFPEKAYAHTLTHKDKYHELSSTRSFLQRCLISVSINQSILVHRNQPHCTSHLWSLSCGYTIINFIIPHIDGYLGIFHFLLLTTHWISLSEYPCTCAFAGILQVICRIRSC